MKRDEIAQALTAYTEDSVRIALDKAFVEWEKRTEERVKEAMHTAQNIHVCENARAEALEEAAKIAEIDMDQHDIAPSIRAIKEKP